MSKGNRTRRKELGLLPQPSLCVGRTRAGLPCKRSPIKGAAVCRAHGGAAPQVQRKAQERIAHASDIAVLQILALMQAADTPSAVKLAAAKDLLDRAQVSGRTTIELQTPAWQQLLDGIVATLPTDVETPMRSFAEGQPEADPLLIEARRVDGERELAAYAPDDKDYSDSWAYGHDLPTTLPRPSRATNAPHPEPAMPRANGDDRPPPRHPLPERRRIEPDDDAPQPYAPSPRPPRRGRVAGHR